MKETYWVFPCGLPFNEWPSQVLRAIMSAIKGEDATLVGKRSPSQTDLAALEAETAVSVAPSRCRDKLDGLIMRCIFGPDRQKR